MHHMRFNAILIFAGHRAVTALALALALAALVLAAGCYPVHRHPLDPGSPWGLAAYALIPPCRTARGIEVWNAVFDGNGGADYGRTATLDPYGNLYVGGFGTNLVTGTSLWDQWIKKVDANGNEDMNWNKQFDGNNGRGVLHAAAVRCRS